MKRYSIPPHSEPLIAAERFLQGRLRGKVILRLVDVIIDDPGYRHVILRAGVHSEDRELPETVIIKRSNLGDRHIMRETMALAVINDLHLDPPLAPRCIAAASEHDLLVLSDLGDVEPTKLKTILYADDAQRATDALVDTAVTLARLHGTAASKIARWKLSITRSMDAILEAVGT